MGVVFGLPPVPHVPGEKGTGPPAQPIHVAGYLKHQRGGRQQLRCHRLDLQPLRRRLPAGMQARADALVKLSLGGVSAGKVQVTTVKHNDIPTSPVHSLAE